MGDIGRDTGCAILEQCFGSVAKGAAGIDDVIDQDAILAAHVTDDVHYFRFARSVAPFVDDGQKRIEALCQSPGTHNTAGIW